MHLSGVNSLPFNSFVIKTQHLLASCLEEEKKAGCFANIVLQMYCNYKCSVALPHGAVGWTAVCDCGITLLYSPNFYAMHYQEKQSNQINTQ